MIIHVGGTGTQDGGTEAQLQQVYRCLKALYDSGARVFHHGDCVGADAQMHDIALRIGYNVVIHPPVDSKKRAFCMGGEMLSCRPYLRRNQDIVNAVSHLVAVTRTNKEESRSGTWATIRYARKMRKRIHMIGV